jgi:hypothetical protein
MSRLWRWPLAALLALFVIGYVRALFIVLPVWALLLGGLLCGLIVRRVLSGRRGGPAGLYRESSPDA